MLDELLQKTPIAGDDWILGPPDALITLLEYGDFECPYCGMVHPVLKSLLAESPDALRLVYRHFPLATVHPHAFQAAEAAEAAGAQGMFWEMHDALFTHQDRLEYADLLRYAATLGLDVERFDREMRENRYLPEVKRDFRRGIQDNVNGTPTIFINGLRYDGPRDKESMGAAIAALIASTR